MLKDKKIPSDIFSQKGGDGDFIERAPERF